MANQLPFVPDELITQAGETQIDLSGTVLILAKDNPHLLDYIWGFTKYIEVEGIGFNQENVFSFGISIYELLRRAVEEDSNAQT